MRFLEVSMTCNTACCDRIFWKAKIKGFLSICIPWFLTHPSPNTLRVGENVLFFSVIPCKDSKNLKNRSKTLSSWEGNVTNCWHTPGYPADLPSSTWWPYRSCYGSTATCTCQVGEMVPYPVLIPENYVPMDPLQVRAWYPAPHWHMGTRTWTLEMGSLVAETCSGSWGTLGICWDVGVESWELLPGQIKKLMVFPLWKHHHVSPHIQGLWWRVRTEPSASAVHARLQASKHRQRCH